MLSEQDVDRELKAALSVSPSPGFEARVLQRVEADRPSRGRARYGWLAAAASLVIAAGAIYALNRTPPAVPQVVQQTAPPAMSPRSEAPIHEQVIEPPRIETVRIARTAARTAPRRAEPEVLVPVNQMEAVRRLVRVINEGRVEVPAEPAQGPMAPPVAVAIAPVVVQPILLSPLGSGTETAAPLNRDPK